LFAEQVLFGDIGVDAEWLLEVFVVVEAPLIGVEAMSSSKGGRCYISRWAPHHRDLGASSVMGIHVFVKRAAAGEV